MTQNERSPGGVRTGLLGMYAVAADPQVDTAQLIDLQARRITRRFKISPALVAVLAGLVHEQPETWRGRV